MQQLASKIKIPTMQTQRHVKASLATASRATMCSGLLHSWVDSPRDLTSVWTDAVIWLEWCGQRPKTPKNTNKTTSESRAGNCSLSHSVFVLLSSWVESPRTHEYVNSACELTYMMLKTAYKPQQCNHIDLWKHAEHRLLIPHCCQSYRVDGLIHPGSMCVCQQWGVFNRNAVKRKA